MNVCVSSTALNSAFHASVVITEEHALRTLVHSGDWAWASDVTKFALTSRADDCNDVSRCRHITRPGVGQSASDRLQGADPSRARHRRTHETKWLRRDGATSSSGAEEVSPPLTCPVAFGVSRGFRRQDRRDFWEASCCCLPKGLFARASLG